MNEEQLEEIGLIADKLDNCIAMLANPMVPAHLHIDCLKSLLPEYSERLKTIVKQSTKSNPWS